MTNDRRRGFRSLWFIGAAGTWCVLSAASVVLAICLAPWLGEILMVVGTGCLTMAGLACAVVSLCMALVLAFKRRYQDLLACLALVPISLLPLLTWFTVGRLYWLPQRQAYSHVADRAKPVIAAIERYTAEHAEPPKHLSDLIPEYLDEVPQTGLPWDPSFGYWRDGDQWGFRIACGTLSFDELYYPPRRLDEHRPWIEMIDGWAYNHE